jgi:hypothetical protein
MGKNISRNEDGTFTVILHLKEDERKQLKKLGKKLELNDFETLKYSVQLVSWWSHNQIEPEEE